MCPLFNVASGDMRHGSCISRRWQKTKGSGDGLEMNARSSAPQPRSGQL